jgi:hypothetical protein
VLQVYREWVTDSSDLVVKRPRQARLERKQPAFDLATRSADPVRGGSWGPALNDLFAACIVEEQAAALPPTVQRARRGGSLSAALEEKEDHAEEDGLAGMFAHAAA